MGDRPAATAAERAWALEFRDLLYRELTPDSTYAEGAAALMRIVQSGLLKHDDIHRNPERFFAAHRILAEHALKLGPGHWIRFTVHYNLCMGTVLAVGNEQQVREMCDLQEEGALGCFALTEKFAGVNSGMIVELEASFDVETGHFLLNSPDKGSYKNWISQGLTASTAVVIANLKLDGQSKGPHAFFMRLRDRTGKLLPGIRMGDMGKKTIGNDLDNAWICFEHVSIPRSALLSRYASVSPTGKYSKKTKVSDMEMVGQRLFTGRVAVAQAAVAFSQRLFRDTESYANNKKCWGPAGTRPALSDVPQLKALFKEGQERLNKLAAFVDHCESELCGVLRKDAIPSQQLQLAIAVAKVGCVEASIELCHRLKQEVGSYALMADAGFSQLDFLTCCKFAEGDSRILLVKMARDAIKAHAKSDGKSTSEEEARLCLEIQQGIAEDPATAMDRVWQQIYQLGWVVVERTLDQWTGPSPSSRPGFANARAKL